MLLLSVIGTFFIAYLPISAGSPPGLSRSRRGAYVFIRSSNLSSCSDEESKRWSYDFHACFIDRKSGDGGRNLETIVDRILDHSKDCMQKSSLGCRPDFQGFLIVMDKVIHQIKDYSNMYLELIYRGRDKIKDLECVERTINMQTYNTCFEDAFNYTSESEFQSNVEDSLFCTNVLNKGCSSHAKSDLSNIVQIILNVNLTSDSTEDFSSESPPTPKIRTSPPRREPPPRREEPPPKKEQPWAWYDYLWKPFEYVWNSFKSIFGF